MKIGLGYLCSASAAALLLPSVAFAQAEVQAEGDLDVSQATPAPQAAPAASPAPGPMTDDGDIVVTAQRRAQSLSDVPASVSVISSDKIEASGLTNSIDLGQVTPGLTVTTLGSFTQPSVRGVSTAIIGIGNPSNVAIYLDGVYQTSQLGNAFDFNDIDHIEVLRGPQGALYGRNATGGAIIITTRRPRFDFGGEASLSYGRFNEVIADGYVTGGLSDTLAASLAVQYRRDDGYLHNVTLGIRAGDVENYSARGRLLFQPNDRFSALLSLEYTRRDDNSAWNSHILDFNSVARARGLPLPADPYDVAHNYDPILHSRVKAVTLQMNYDFDFATLTSTTGYRNTRGHILQDPDYSPADLSKSEWFQEEEALSEELTLTSRGSGRFSWILGAYGSTENNGYDPYVSNGVELLATQDVKSASIFGTASYRLGGGFTIDAGARYSWERKHYVATRPTLGQSRDIQDSWTAFTPQASLRWEFAPRSLLWFTYSRGFKSGGYNGSGFPDSPFAPESVNGYEFGGRTRIGREFSFEASAYHYDYSDVQVSAATPSSNPGAPTTAVTNAASVNVNGLDLTATLTPIQRLNISLGYSYIDATYADFPNAIVTAPLPGGGNSQFISDVSGNEVTRAPKHTATLGVNYRQPIGYGSLIADANLYLSSGFFGDFGNRLKQPAYEVLNGQLTWALPGDHVRISLWGRNLTNQLYATLVLDSAFGDRAIYARPRTYGVRVNFSF